MGKTKPRKQSAGIALFVVVEIKGENRRTDGWRRRLTTKLLAIARTARSRSCPAAAAVADRLLSVVLLLKLMGLWTLFAAATVESRLEEVGLHQQQASAGLVGDGVFGSVGQHQQHMSHHGSPSRPLMATSLLLPWCKVCKH
jgi:hypothetical protein